MVIASQKLKPELMIDVEALVQELLSIDKEDWTAHVNADVYSGDWTVLPLRALKEFQNANPILQANHIHSDGEWQDLPRLAELPVIGNLLTQIQTHKKSVRLMKLGSNAKIFPHRDDNLCLEKGEARLHLPLTTDAQVHFYSNRHRLEMKAGELWYVNADQEHSVVNEGNSERIHLVIDVTPNDWLMSQLDKEKLNMAKMAPTPQSLADLTQQLMTGEKDFAAMMPISKQIAEIYGAWTGISLEDDMNNWNDIWTDMGVAISPLQAAKCLVEPLRTQTFLLGNQAAITDLLAHRLRSGDSEDTAINILYAGTGPWGSILTPLLPGLKKLPIRVTCLDIHQENIAALQKVLKQLDVEEMVTLVHADATKWTPQDNTRFDMIISETMSSFLCREPQVCIFAHLEQFLKPEGKLIPENIRTSIWMGEPLSVYDTDKNKPSGADAEPPYKLTDLFHLNRETAAAIQRGERDLLSFEFVLPDQKGVIDKIYEVTDIVVYGEFFLDLHQSSLCRAAARLHFHGIAGDTVRYTYLLQENPNWDRQLPDCFADAVVLDASEKSPLGLCYLPHLWSKYRLLRTPHFASQGQDSEIESDHEFCAIFGVMLFNVMNFMAQGYPTMEEFDAWFKAEADNFSKEKINQVNQRFC